MLSNILKKKVNIENAFKESLTVFNYGANTLPFALTFANFLSPIRKIGNNPWIVNPTVLAAPLFTVFGGGDGFCREREINKYQIARDFVNAINRGVNLWLFMNQFADQFVGSFCTTFGGYVKNDQCHDTESQYWTIVAIVGVVSFLEFARYVLEEMNIEKFKKWFGKNYQDSCGFRLFCDVVETVDNASIFQTFPAACLPYNLSWAPVQTSIFGLSLIAGAVPPILKRKYSDYEKPIDDSMWTISSLACLLWFGQYLITHEKELFSKELSWFLFVAPLAIVTLLALSYAFVKGPIDKSETKAEEVNESTGLLSIQNVKKQNASCWASFPFARKNKSLLLNINQTEEEVKKPKFCNII